MPKLRPIQDEPAPDAFEKEFGDKKPSKKIRPSRRRVQPDAFEMEFSEAKPKKRYPRKKKALTVGDELKRMQDKVLNPKTGRWVKKTGAIGRKLLRS